MWYSLDSVFGFGVERLRRTMTAPVNFLARTLYPTFPYPTCPTAFGKRGFQGRLGLPARESCRRHQTLQRCFASGGRPDACRSPPPPTNPSPDLHRKRTFRGIDLTPADTCVSEGTRTGTDRCPTTAPAAPESPRQHPTAPDSIRSIRSDRSSDRPDKPAPPPPPHTNRPRVTHFRNKIDAQHGHKTGRSACAPRKRGYGTSGAVPKQT